MGKLILYTEYIQITAFWACDIVLLILLGLEEPCVQLWPMSRGDACHFWTELLFAGTRPSKARLSSPSAKIFWMTAALSASLLGGFRQMTCSFHCLSLTWLGGSLGLVYRREYECLLGLGVAFPLPLSGLAATDATEPPLCQCAVSPPGGVGPRGDPSLTLSVMGPAAAFSVYSSFSLVFNNQLLLFWFFHINLIGCSLFNHWKCRLHVYFNSMFGLWFSNHLSF